MNIKIYTAYDSKAEIYLQPFFMRAKGEAIRAFSDMCNDPKTQFGAHPEDFVLFELGEYSDQDGKLVPHDAPVSCCLGHELVVGKDS